jgi:hypothetical protein
MFFKYIVLALVSITFMACSSIKMPKATYATHDSMHDIPAIDEMIVSMKREYIDKCYAPVVHKEPPENACQTELFQQLERRYHTNYNQQQVNMASDDLFFKDINTKLRQMMRSEPAVREAIRNGAFSSAEDMLAYYKNKYSFTHN